MQIGVDHLHARVTQGTSNNLDASVMAVKSHLRYQNSYWL
jgi:hypothetical protein